MRALLVDLGAAAGATLLVLLLLLYLHGELQPVQAVVGGVLAGVVLRRLLARSVLDFPPFLRRPLAAGVVVLGSLLVAWATLALYAPSYWVLRRRQALELPLAAALLGLALGAAVFTHARLRKVVEEARAREAAQREAALRAQLQALQAQINPHFLFNALNAVAEMAHEDPDVAESLIGDLSHLLRYSLRSSAAGLVPLAQELEAVERYLSIERARFGERLRADVQADAAAREWRVPGLILQPLVENSVRHAVGPERRCRVRVDARVESGALHVVVEDDGPGLPQEVRERLARVAASPEPSPPPGAEDEGAGTGGAGGGLANVARRLALAYRGAGRMDASASEGGGARFDLWMPAA